MIGRETAAWWRTARSNIATVWIGDAFWLRRLSAVRGHPVLGSVVGKCHVEGFEDKIAECSEPNDAYRPAISPRRLSKDKLLQCQYERDPKQKPTSRASSGRLKKGVSAASPGQT